MAEKPGIRELRWTVRPWQLATGSLACPDCDAPVALMSDSASPTDPLSCPFCAHAATVRHFLSLASPLRAPRVNVMVRPLRP